MLFCQLGRANTLREIAGGLRSCEGKLKHLGISAPSHSTLAYANEHRPWVLYQQLSLKLFDRCRAQVGSERLDPEMIILLLLPFLPSLLKGEWPMSK